MIMTFNGTASTDVSLDIGSIMKVARPIYPGARARTQAITGRDGVFFHGKDRREKYIPVRFHFASASMSARRTAVRNLSDWLDVDEPAELIFNDEPAVRYHAIPVNEIVPDEVVFLGWAEVNFLVPSGYAESTTTKTASPNEGTLETPVEITATMQGASNDLRITLGSEHILITPDVAFALNDEIIIDTNIHYVTINGSDAREYVSFASTYFKLPVGAFTLTPDPVGTTVEILYRERFK